MRKTHALVVAAIALVTGPALADEAAQQPEGDTNKVICRTVAETGSRLKAKKICMTAAEWAEQRRQNRQLIERSQLNACTPGANC